MLVARQYTHGEFGDVKTNAGRRTVGLDATLAAELAAWKLSREPDHKQPGSLVVATANGGPLSASNFLSRDLYPALDRAKLPRVGLHSLRHTFVTALRSSDAPIGVVHQILGHANYATTAKLYGSVTDAALTAAADAAAAAFVPNVHKPGTTDSVAS